MKTKKILMFLVMLLSLESFGQALFDWQRSYCPSGDIGFVATSGQMDSAGNTYYAGNINTGIDIDPGPGVVNLVPIGQISSYILKLDEHGDFASVIQYGNPAANGLVSIAVIDMNAHGEMIVLGTFNGTVDFDPGPSTFHLTAGGTFGVENFLLKFDSNGNFEWAYKGTYYISQLHLLDNGEIITVRDSDANDVTDLDLTSNVQNVNYPVDTKVIVKLNSAGGYLWHQAIQPTNGPDPLGISRVRSDSLGNTYFLGAMNYVQVFDPGGINHILDPLIQQTAGGASLLMKLSDQGNLLWEHVIVDSVQFYPVDIAVGPELHLHLIGAFRGEIDTDFGVSTYVLSSRISSFFGTPALDFVVAKYTTNGDFIWAGSFGHEENDDSGTAKIRVDNDGNSYVTSKYNPGVLFDIDPGPDTVSLTAYSFGHSCFILKLDSMGAMDWVETAHSDYVNLNGTFATASPVNFSLNQDAIFIAGLFYGGTDFDIEENSVYADSCFNSGDAIFMWQLDLCDPVEIVDSITSCDNMIWMDGNTYSSDTNAIYTIETPGQCDTIYRLVFEKLEESIRIDSVTSCGPYTWINGATYSLSTTTPLFVLPQPAVNGCDSIVNLHVNITQITNAAVQNGTTIEASLNNAQYQWLDCDNNFAPLIGDTLQSFTASVNGNYAVEVTNGNCVDTSACFSVTTVGMSEMLDEHSVRIYPNPSYDHIDIECSVHVLSITILDSKGREQLTSSNKHIDVSNLANGIYLIHIETEWGRISKRFTKQ